MGRLPVPVINNSESYQFEIGKAVTLREGTDATIVATGLMVARAMEAADMLKDEGIEVQVLPGISSLQYLVYCSFLGLLL